MKLHQVFKASLYEPKKLAAFRLLSIGKVFQYTFGFVTLFTLISFIRFTVGDAVLFEASPELMEYSQSIGGLVYPIAFIFQLVISTFYIFVRICLFAYIGVLLLKMMKRRDDYRFIWRTSAISMTVPILLTFFFDFFPLIKPYSLVLTSIVHIAYIAAAARYYPKTAR
ncbi:DUF1189 family protein [Sporosarcina sp. HYO08]|uniref:DUF1189 family protein n=1 Tax=Sporosarcina sp. HYO08 TaxID=1759557 RepID=UPI00079494A1|nr:DUF1189 family protein [Sporosarcina sp. HYO08]KXH87431.1 hypothetical protein AU377_02345 [Sporosarcina sp. HYO08]